MYIHLNHLLKSKNKSYLYLCFLITKLFGNIGKLSVPFIKSKNDVYRKRTKDSFD